MLKMSVITDIIKSQLAIHGIAKKGLRGLRSSVFRFNLRNGRQEHIPKFLTGHAVGRWQQ